MTEKPKCMIDGCSNLALPKYKRKDGSVYYRKLCTKHHREKYNMPYDNRKAKKCGETYDMDRSVCVLCGWDKAPCDRHRIVFGCDGGGYTIKNVISVCPNCHRLIHLGLLDVNND